MKASYLLPKRDAFCRFHLKKKMSKKNIKNKPKKLELSFWFEYYYLRNTIIVIHTSIAPIYIS